MDAIFRHRLNLDTWVHVQNECSAAHRNTKRFPCFAPEKRVKPDSREERFEVCPEGATSYDLPLSSQVTNKVNLLLRHPNMACAVSSV